MQLNVFFQNKVGINNLLLHLNVLIDKKKFKPRKNFFHRLGNVSYFKIQIAEVIYSRRNFCNSKLDRKSTRLNSSHRT